MNVLGISGSPRIGGNTDILLDKVLEGARQKGAGVEKLILNQLRFSPCQECEVMSDDGSCLIVDDWQIVYQRIKEADILILASPIFFGSLSAQTKMMIDRFQCAWRAKYVFKKNTSSKKIKGVFISVEASDRIDFFDNAKSIVKHLFSVIGADYKEELFCSNIDERAAILKHKGCLKKASDLGAKIVS